MRSVRYIIKPLSRGLRNAILSSVGTGSSSAGDRPESCSARARAHTCFEERQDAGASRDEARQLLDSIEVSTISGLRDRALIALLVYSFARISAALQMVVEDYYAPRTRAGPFRFSDGAKLIVNTRADRHFRR